MTDSQDRNPVEILADEFVELKRQGAAPKLEEFASQHPEHADEIRDLFPLLVEMEGARSEHEERPLATARTAAPKRLGDYRILRELGRGGMGVVYEAEQISLGRHVALKVLPQGSLMRPTQLQRFQREARLAARLHHTNIVPVYGVGTDDDQHFYAMQYISGLGLDEVLNELREVRSTDGDSAEGNSAQHISLTSRSLILGAATEEYSRDSDRQEQESRKDTDAHLQHQETTPVDPAGVGVDSAAITSDEHFSESGGVYWRSVAHVGRQVADALQYAADQGVQHRDIKPSNLLLDATQRTWVTDFGLAKANAKEDDLTKTGDVVGTLAYMAPERFSGQGDIRSDLYSLGLTLYELATLKPAFEDTDRGQLVRKVLNDAPIRPRTLAPTIPRDLETIILKSISREPTDRYQTAVAMANDLERFLEDRPILARRFSEVEKFVRWCRRNPLAAGWLGAFVMTLVFGLIATTWQWGLAADATKQKELERQQAVIERSNAVEARNLAENYLYASNVARAQLIQQSPQFSDAEYILDTCPRDLRGWDWRLLKQRQHADLRTMTGHTGWVDRVIFSPDGKLLASSGGGNPFPFGDRRPGEIIIWDAETGEKLHVITPKQDGHADMIHGLAFHPDGKTLASGSHDRSLKLWDVASGRLLQEIKLKERVETVAYSHDGSMLAAGCYNHVMVWKTDSLDEPWRNIDQVSFGVAGLRFSADDRHLAAKGLGYFSQPGATKIWDLETGKQAVELENSQEMAYGGVEYVGDQYLLGCFGDMIHQWDVETGQLVFQSKLHLGPIRDVAASRNRIATCGDDASIRVWTSDFGDELLQFRGHAGQVNTVAFSPDGNQLASGGIDGAIKIWDLTLHPEFASVPNRATGGPTIGFDETGDVITSVTPNGIVERTRVSDHAPISRFALQGFATRNHIPGEKAHIGRHSKFVVAAGRDKGRSLACWELNTGKVVREYKGHTAPIVFVTMDNEERVIASATRNDRGPGSEVRVWDRESGAVLFERKFPDTFVTRVALSSGLLAVADGVRREGKLDSTIRVIEYASGEVKQEFRSDEDLWYALSFSADGKRLGAAGAYNRRLLIWEFASDEKLFNQQSPINAFDLAFHPDGSRIAIAGMKGTYLVDGQTGQFILSLRTVRQSKNTTQGFNPRVRWSDDGKRLFVSALSHSVWTAYATVAEAVEEHRRLRPRRAAVRDLDLFVRRQAKDDKLWASNAAFQAEELLKHYQDAPLDTYRLRLWRAKTAAVAGRVDLARKDIAEASRIRPDAPAARNEMMSAYLNIGDWRKALEEAKAIPAGLVGMRATERRLALLAHFLDGAEGWAPMKKFALEDIKNVRPNWVKKHLDSFDLVASYADFKEDNSRVLESLEKAAKAVTSVTLKERRARQQSRIALFSAQVRLRMGDLEGAAADLKKCQVKSLTGVDQARWKLVSALHQAKSGKTATASKTRQETLDLVRKEFGGLEELSPTKITWHEWMRLKIIDREVEASLAP